MLLSTLSVQKADAQRIIRKNNRHYINQLSLPNKVEPLLKDVWDQYAPNNLLCPIDSTGKQCVVGCVATAMSQVMHYWQWPECGRGSHEYEDSIGCKLIMSADFSKHTYDWANMLDVYKEGQYTQAQADAVALLSLDCGISVNMRYGAETSGAESVRQPMALTEYFGYDKGIQFLFRDFYSLEELTFMLKKELAEGRPILISGHNKGGGHAFVIDGYDENDWFHTCWGNPGGVDNTYTYLPHMVPNQPQWYSKDSPENGLNILQMFTIGIMPENHEKATGIERHNFAFQYINAVVDSTKTDVTEETDTTVDPEPEEPKEPEYIGDFGGEGDPLSKARSSLAKRSLAKHSLSKHSSARRSLAKYKRNEVLLTVHDMCNIGWNMHNDSVSLMLQKDGKTVCPLYTYDHEFLLEELEDTTYTDTLSISIPKSVANGTYTIVPMFKDNALDSGKEWREAKVCAGQPNYLIATVKDNEVALSTDTASWSYLTLEDIDFPDLFLNGTAPDYGVTLKNHGPEMAGRLYFMLESILEDGPSFLLQSQGITVGANEEYTMHNRLTKLYAPKLGTYRLHLMYECNLFADELIELELPQEYLVTILTAGSIQIAQR